jgi:3'-phosphoadenosine 5'-phosphosulfate sulfotransferase (PAPS reductase)/FAD synthetase
MYTYEWDTETGGFLLTSSSQSFSKEPRPVYYKELDILGFDRYWNYAKNHSNPYMWAEANNYIYRGRLVAKTKGGSLYTAPELILVEDPEPAGQPLRFVDIPAMVEKNRDLLEKLVGDTIKKIYNTYVEYKDKVDVFYVAFSGGKDSVVALDLVQRSLPHNKIKVLFGDTQMEFPDTYDVVEKIENYCKELNIQFYRAKSNMSPQQTWKSFGPPAVTNRWCCSVHKTSPQIVLLQEITGHQGFTGMAFTGIRAEESAARSEYDDVSFGKKNRGQFSCHPILEWNSAELFLYIYSRDLIINEAYKKGNTRAGCLVCPMSSGKHEYMKHICYKDEVDQFAEYIKETSGKTAFTEAEMTSFIDDGNWKTRKTGRELNFGVDLHTVEVDKGKTTIRVSKPNPTWKIWAKTIGDFIEVNAGHFNIVFAGKTYVIKVNMFDDGSSKFSFPNCETTKDDIKFISLFRSVIIKSLYCVQCGVCAANCSAGCIDMKNGLSISDQCRHCYQCHDIHEYCLRYNSIRNKSGGDHKMKGLDRYFSFGIRKSWLDIYFKYEGSDEFWDTDGNGEVPNKKKDAFLNFTKDAGIVTYDKSKNGNKYTKNVPNDFARVLFKLGSDSEITWGLMLCNLVYTPEFNWFVTNLPYRESITPDRVKYMLESVMENDTKGLGKRNICDALKMFLVKTPFGGIIGFGHCDYDEKVSATGNETITLKSFYRGKWENPDPLTILYSLYKFAEACGDYYQFTLTRLLNHEIDSDGISPTEIFGLERAQMEKLLNGLAINYPDFITTGFTLDLDNITLNSNKTSADVLKLF